MTVFLARYASGTFAFVALAGCVWAAVPSHAGFGPSRSDPYAYRELTTTASSPTEIRPGFFDFGRDGIGWLEFKGVATGAYEIVIGEMTNAAGHVANDYPGSAVRCQRLKGEVAPGPAYRVPMPPDKWNLTGYSPKYCPAIKLPEWAGIVSPFRFVEIVKAPGPIGSANLVRTMVHHPIDMEKSSFACDNPVLNDVYEFCKYSILATSFAGIYVDGDRERTPYEADAYITQLGHYAIDNDYTMARRSCEWLMEHPTWPTEWKQHQIKMSWADWMWTGDTRSVAKHWERLTTEKLLAKYVRPEDGLLLTGGEVKKGCRIPGSGDIVDWPEPERESFEFKPVNGVINAFYYRNLIELSQMARALGKAEEAEGFLAKAKAVRIACRKLFLDPGTGLFVDGEGSRHTSLQANAAALAFGLVEKDEVPRIVGFLEGEGMGCGVYFAQYLLEAFCEAGRADLAIRLMASSGDRSWKGMMDFGSTISMEAWNMRVMPGMDLNHAWSTAPLNVISRYILGVTPAEPGFARIAVRPQLGGLKWVKATVPTAKGLVRLEARDGRLQLDVPAAATVTWKGRTQEIPAGRTCL